MSTNSIVDAVPSKVVIVGAGLSGLATARRILSKTENTLEKLPSILIVEARNRVGGRTETYEILDAKIDVGAQWIGSSHTKLLDLINTFGFCLLEQFYPSSPMMEEIKAESRLIECVNYKIAPLSDTDNKSLQTYINLVEDLSSKIDLLNLSSCFEEYRLFDTMSVEQHIRDNIDASSEGAISEALLFTQTVMACEPCSISFLHFLLYIKSGGGMVALGDGEEGAQKYKVAGGMQQLSDAMLQHLQEKGVEIMFNTPVQLVSVSAILFGICAFKYILQAYIYAHIHTSIDIQLLIIGGGKICPTIQSQGRADCGDGESGFRHSTSVGRHHSIHPAAVRREARAIQLHGGWPRGESGRAIPRGILAVRPK